MPHLDMEITWNLHLTTEEYRLVAKALGGRLKPEECEDAKKLADALHAQRIKCADSWAKSIPPG